MPTAVATARQCLTDEAARALDDAVSVAKRRNHAQTTSLHAVSALLSPSVSLLKDSLTRCRSSAYSPRLQFRALELCVGVSLDRLPSSKNNHDQNDDFAPPISNSLMAAIKRSQAHQRRQPDIYHFGNNNNNFINNNNNNNINTNANISISSIKVELKHFVLSILDDPIVSRVFGEAGFRSSEIKLAIIHPPRWAPGPITSPGLSPGSRCPPLFLCNLMDFPGYFGENNNSGSDENCKRISEVMVKKKENNPLLVGVCAKDALARFKDCILKKKFDGFHVGIHGLKLICLENEIKEIIKDNDGLDLKIKEVKSMVENESSCKVVINLGDLKGLMDEESDFESVKKVVLKMSNLVEQVDGNNNKQIWLIGFATNYETYSNFVGKFPTVEKDWDLHPLPITSSRSSFDGSKSSLMGSFVPFAGFFPTPSDYRPPLNAVRPSFTRCNACNEKYEFELGALTKEGPSASFSDQPSTALPSWLPRSNSDLSRGVDIVAQVKDVKMASNEKIKQLQNKWDDHCRQTHQSSLFAAPGVSLARLQVPQPFGFPFMGADNMQGSSSSGECSLNERACSSTSSGMQIVAQAVSPQQQIAKSSEPAKRALEAFPCHSTDRERSASTVYPVDNFSLPPNQTTTVSVTVTTDLGLGTIYASKLDPKKSFLQDRQPHFMHFSGPISTNQAVLNKKDPARSPLQGLDSGDYKTLFRKLCEAAAWQSDAISKIVQTISCCRSGIVSQRGTNIRGNIWLSFLGPDKIGKKRIAEELADAMFGSRDRLIVVDLSMRDSMKNVNSVFLCQGSHDFDINMSRKTVVDHIAQELCKKPHSVVFLENIDEADPMLQNSLSRALQIGKFQDSRGKEIGINNVIFVMTTTVTKNEKSLSPRKEFIKFQEEKILQAKNWQMQLAIRTVSIDASSRSNEAIVSLLPTRGLSNQDSPSKRKLSNIICETSNRLEAAKRAHKSPKNSLDLNLPLEGDEEEAGDEMDIFGRAWLDGFFSQMDGNVDFKPYDFDALADKLLRKIRSKFEEMHKGERITLEIDHEVMVQILAATWCSSNNEAVEHWIEHVLCTNFDEARQKYNLSAESVVRLCSSEGIPVKEWTPGIRLPKQINLGI